MALLLCRLSSSKSREEGEIALVLQYITLFNLLYHSCAIRQPHSPGYSYWRGVVPAVATILWLQGDSVNLPLFQGHFVCTYVFCGRSSDAPWFILTGTSALNIIESKLSLMHTANPYW